MIKVKRNHTALIRMSNDGVADDYMKTSPGERISFIWELTAELWSLKEPKSAEQRLQRNVTNLIKQQD